MSVTNPLELEEEAHERGPAAGAAIRQTSLWKDAWKAVGKQYAVPKSAISAYSST